MVESGNSSFLAEVWQIVINNYPTFIQGTITTLIISITATVLGFFLGLL